MVRWFIDRSPSRATPSVSLRRLLPEATFAGGNDWEVSGCSADAATVEPGEVYVALSDDEYDGHDDVAGAVGRGAAGVVVERPCPTADGRMAVVRDTRDAHARIRHALAGDPAERLALVALAGDRDTASISRLLRAIFERTGEIFGTVGTGDWSDGLATRALGPDRLDPEGVAGMFAAMAARGCSGGLIEASPAAIESTAIARGYELAAVVATESYGDLGEDDDARMARRRAYARLIRRVRPGGIVVVDEDDPDSEVLGAVNLLADRVSIGIDRQADVRGTVESASPTSIRLRLEGQGLDATVVLRPGMATMRHALAAAATAWARGIGQDAIVAGLESVAGPTERAASVVEGQSFEVLIEEARTPDDLARTLGGLRVAGVNRIICVVGSEGQGEVSARRRLAEAVESNANLVVFTNDNPRGEDPARIFDELKAGTRRPDRVRVVPDRREAIETALAEAGPGDAVVIAGKGRRAFQILADRVIPFDDRAVAARWLRASASMADASRRSSA